MCVAVSLGGMLLFGSSCFDVEEDKRPEIESFSPTSVVAGDAITLKGKNFKAEGRTTHVAFDGYSDGILAKASKVNDDGTEMTVYVPPGFQKEGEAKSYQAQIQVILTDSGENWTEGKHDSSLSDTRLTIEVSTAKGPVDVTLGKEFVVKGGPFPRDSAVKIELQAGDDRDTVKALSVGKNELKFKLPCGYFSKVPREVIDVLVSIDIEAPGETTRRLLKSKNSSELLISTTFVVYELAEQDDCPSN